MIERVRIEGTTFAPPPQRFEAGTPAGPEAHGLAAALDWLEALGLDAVAAHEAALVERTVAGLDGLEGVRRIGTPREQVGVVSFVVDGAHAHDVGTVLDAAGVAVRAGHHCAQPAMESFGVPATVRASFGVYNDAGDVERLLAGVAKARRLLAG
jgi:cysteine desulfurase/selenocysteine lyase